MVATAAVIRARSSFKLAGKVGKNFVLTYPHTEKWLSLKFRILATPLILKISM
jgi:hypothetical protein